MPFVATQWGDLLLLPLVIESSNVTTTFEASSSRYTVEPRDGRVVHRETRLDHDGRVLAQVEAEVKYARRFRRRAESRT